MNTLDLLKLTKKQKANDGIWLSGTKGEGEFRQWHYNGQLWKKVFYKNDERHGKYLMWYNNEQLWERSYYKYNEKHGEYLVWYEDGTLHTKAYYINGELISNEHS